MELSRYFSQLDPDMTVGSYLVGILLQIFGSLVFGHWELKEKKCIPLSSSNSCGVFPWKGRSYGKIIN